LNITKKYGSAFYGIQKMYLLMEKQHNRGQDGAGFAVKLDVEPGGDILAACDLITQTYSGRFAQINDRINEEMALHPNMQTMYRRKKTNIHWSYFRPRTLRTLEK
jgi:amidophosphoribosyltransferase